MNLRVLGFCWKLSRVTRLYWRPRRPRRQSSLEEKTGREEKEVRGRQGKKGWTSYVQSVEKKKTTKVEECLAKEKTLLCFKRYLLAKECNLCQNQPGWCQNWLASDLALRLQQGFDVNLEFPSEFFNFFLEKTFYIEEKI